MSKIKSPNLRGLSFQIMVLLGIIAISMTALAALIFMNSRVIDNYSFLINESGKIRGGIQRIIKLAVLDKETEEYMRLIDDSVETLKSQFVIKSGIANEIDSAKILTLEQEWKSISLLLQNQNNSNGDNSKLYEKSEKLWTLTNQIVFDIENKAHASIRLYFYIILSMVVLILVITVVIVATKLIIHDKIEYRADHDNLTGLFNRHYFNALFEREILIAKRTGRMFAILMCDIDNFKNVNDVYGHTVGDEVLQRVSKVIKSTSRNTDFVARFGGEEFIILALIEKIPETKKYAEKIRSAVERETGFDNMKITISIGIAVYESHMDAIDLINNADKALYLAKKYGKNRVEI